MHCTHGGVRDASVRLWIVAVVVAFTLVAATRGAVVTVPGAAHATPHPKGCSPGWSWLSSQDWWIRVGDEINPQTNQLANDFGHIHTELCFPHMAHVSGVFTVTVTSIMHHNPGEFRKLGVQIFGESNSIISDCSETGGVYCNKFGGVPRTVATCVATGGEIIGDQTCKWIDIIPIDTTLLQVDGWQDFRFRASVDQTTPTGATEEMRTSTGLHAFVSNGNPRNDYSFVLNNIDLIESRGWYEVAEYTTTDLHSPPMIPVRGLWRLHIELEPGAGGIAVTSHLATINPAFHVGNSGTILQQGDNEWEGNVIVDTTTLTNGWHKLGLQSHAFEPNSGSTNVATGVHFFEVLNNNDLRCGVDVQTSVKEDSYVRGGDDHEDANFESDAVLEIKHAGSEQYTRKAYMKFDVGPILSGVVRAAVLSLRVNKVEGSSPILITIYAVDPTTWSSSTLTWNYQPMMGAHLTTTTVYDDDEDTDVMVDLTTHLNSRLSGGASDVGLVFVQEPTTPGDAPLNRKVVFDSSNGDHPAILRLTPHTTLCWDGAPTTSSPTSSPTTSPPTSMPTTSPPIKSPTSANPTLSPITFEPTASPMTSTPTTSSPTTSTPTASPTTSAPTTSSPTTSTPTSSPTTSTPTAPPASSSPTTATPTIPTATIVSAVRDTYVRSGKYANHSYGGDCDIRVKDGGKNYDRETLVAFSLAGLQLPVSAAALSLAVDSVQNADTTIKVFETTTAWTNSVTYTTKPTPLSTTPEAVVMVLESNEDSYVSFSVTNAVNRALAANQIEVAFVLLDDVNQNRQVRFYSLEHGDNLPPLLSTTP